VVKNLSLLELQEAIQNIVYNGGDIKDFEYRIASYNNGKTNTRERLWIHHNNTYSSLLKYLQGLFEGTYKSMGACNFKEVGVLYIQEYPLKSPILCKYGSCFPLFLKEQKVLEPIVELSSFEWKVAKTFYILDKKIILSLGEVFKYSEDKFLDMVLDFQPHVSLFKSQYNAVHLWKKLKDKDSLKAVNLSGNKRKATYFIIFKYKDSIQYKKVNLCEFSFLKALMEKSTFQEALEEAFLHDNYFNFKEVLLTIFNLGLVCDMKLKSERKNEYSY